ncbi:MAG: hypothetical protein KKH68_14550 [Proteobacteria bacterium]|nr:hypothetical protein [Pseudomonadota bacterium]
MTSKNIIKFLVILLFIISCAVQNTESKEKLSDHSQTTGVQTKKQPKAAPLERKQEGYVPGEILIKFKEGTDDQAIKAIQRELHLEVIRLVSKPNLFLMKILDESSVESVIKRLQNYQEVKYSEPNYLKSTY